LEPTLILSLTGLAMFVTAGLVWRLPVGRCQECPHCREAEQLEAEQQRQQVSQSAISPGRCPRCGREHDPGEEH
jgi:hypothetical protein